MRMICCSQRLQTPSRRSRSPAAEEPAPRVSGPEEDLQRVSEERFSIQPHPGSFKSIQKCLLFSSHSHLLLSLFICVSAGEATLSLCLGFHGNKTYRTLCRAENILRERDSGEKSICRTSRELQVPAESKPQKANAVFYHPFFILSFY